MVGFILTTTGEGRLSEDGWEDGERMGVRGVDGVEVDWWRWVGLAIGVLAKGSGSESIPTIEIHVHVPNQYLQLYMYQ